jgi:GxxExxY protein
LKTNSKPEGAEGAELRGLNQVTERIIGAAIEVHRHLGPGLLESAYEECLCYELSQMGLQFRRQVHLPINYKGLKLDCAYKMDLVIEDQVVVELKAIDDLLPIRGCQLLTYLKASGKPVGLLINFSEPVLKNGLKRIVNRYLGPLPKPENSAPSARELSRRDELSTSLLNSPRPSPRLRVSELNTAPVVKERPL